MMTFLRFAKQRRPCSMPFTTEAKLSSRTMRSAASLLTSEPLPMARPQFACFSAGASFTPSPVTPTHSPWAWNSLTIWSFCFGVVREKTAWRYWQMACQSSSSRRSSSGPVRTMAQEPGGPRGRAVRRPAPSTSSVLMMPTCCAIALAVAGWSPVTIATRTCAAWHCAMASRTPARGGSRRATQPRKVRPDMGKFGSSTSKAKSPPKSAAGSLSWQKPRIRCPWAAACSMECRTAERELLVSWSSAPVGSATVLHLSSIRSGAPFISSSRSPSSGVLWTESMYLLVLLKGTSASFANLSRVDSASGTAPETTSWQ
mmetsp:Transcript_27828/g.83115  ORF Transcript_27828/g.83115 Transcript_27828/m.83115 type:complete len:315 (+) Transcript_27828:859-1803(+)